MTVAPDSTAIRVALWRALHVLVDDRPHVFEDVLGLELADVGPNWRSRRDMGMGFSAGPRASIAARSRFSEDVLAEAMAAGVAQYVLLGAGLDTLAARRPELQGRLEVFEIDQAGPQEWKRQRLRDLGYARPWWHLVSADLRRDDWVTGLSLAGFDPDQPAVVVANGLSMYLSRQENVHLLRDVAGLCATSILVWTFMMPGGARGPFTMLLSPEEAREMVAAAGLQVTSLLSARDLTAMYFDGRPDDLRPSPAERILVASVPG